MAVNEMQARRFMNDVPEIVEGWRSKLSQAKANFSTAVSAINSISSTYAEHITTINGYSAGQSVSRDLLKAELAAYIPIFNAFKNAAQDLVDEMSTITEF